MHRTALTCLLLLLSLVAPAGATTVGVTDYGEYGPSEWTVADDTGVANDLRIRTGGDRLEVEDPSGVTVDTGGGFCRAVSSTTAVCEPVWSGGLRVEPGAGDDSVAFEGACRVGLFIDDGPGEDVIGPSACDWVTIVPGPGDDSIAGGPGRDTLEYGDSPVGVDASLLRGDARTGRETDTLRGIDVLHGSRYADVLVGDGGPNVLAGRGGDDRIDGGAGDDEVRGDDADEDNPLGPDLGQPYSVGDDVLEGGPGRDRIMGGEGVDVYDGGPNGDTILAGAASRLDCGDGSDVVGWSRPQDVLVGCEARWFDAYAGARIPLGSPAADERWRTRFPVECYDVYEGQRCHVVASVREATSRRLLGRVVLHVDYRKDGVARLALSDAGKRLLRRRGRLVARVSVKVWEDEGVGMNDGFSIVLSR